MSEIRDMEHRATAIEAAVEKYPWWSGARLMLLRAKGEAATFEPYTPEWLLRLLHHRATLPLRSIDVARLRHLSDDDIIDRFLRHGSYRIVAEEGEAESIAEPQNDILCDDEELVSEDLAEIYLNQGLYEAAIDTYRKLSLLNSEKSVYFAGLIAKAEKLRAAEEAKKG
ncbi:MAG: hypothetical protein IKC57_01920 [Alistipes sp.]|nr:hypothetical protein [Alistipes sp.]